MSESIKTLKALRDATIAYYGAKMSSDLVAICDRAIASLAAEPVAEEDGWSVARCVQCGQTWTFNVTPPMCAVRGTSMRCTPIPRAHEQPKPCAGFVCGYSPTCVEPHSGDAPCRKCDQPYSAHQQPSAEQAQQPAQAKERIWFCKIGGIVDPMPHGADGPMREAVAEAFKRLNGHAEPAFIFSGWGGELTEPERAVVENRLPVEQPAPADVPLGCACVLDADLNIESECLLHLTVRKERDEARRELAALKGQEPVAWRGVRCRNGETHFTTVKMPYSCEECFASQKPLYAAPLPPPDSIPLAQHEAALAEARRGALREALALVERDRMGAAVHLSSDAWSALNLAADGIRALAEKGGKVRK